MNLYPRVRKMERNINEILKDFEAGKIPELTEELWYDWFCNDSSLPNKTVILLKKLKQISESKKFDNEKCYVFFKNNCPLQGSLYDDFRICDIETGDVIYTICPTTGYDHIKKLVKEKKLSGTGQIWGKDNKFEKTLIDGDWKEIKNWFLI